MSSWIDRLAGKGRRGGNGVLVQIAREVVGRRRSVQGAISEVRHPAVLDVLSDDDFKALDRVIEERRTSDREFAQVLARLTHAAAHAKSFDRQTVDAALRLDSLLPADDPAHEREKLLRDAYRAAQRAGYVQGGRRAMSRLGQRAFDAGDTERARVLLEQQVDLGPETMDSVDEVGSAILLADILRREGDTRGAVNFYRRAGRSAQRLDDYNGLAEALLKQLELMGSEVGRETRVALQEQALDAAKRTGDRVIQSRIVVGLAGTLIGLGRLDDAIAHLETGLLIARDIGDLTLENECLAMLSDVERKLGRMHVVADRERELVQVEERLGNKPAAAADAVQLGTTLLSIGRLDESREAFERAVRLARTINNEVLEQRAFGGLGVVHTQLNRPVEALNNLMQALDLARAARDSAHEAQWLGSIGEALWKFDQPADAVQAINQAVAVARRVDDHDLHAGMLSLLGRIYASGRQVTKARECQTQALEIYRRLGRADEEIAALSALGALAMEAGQTNQAIGFYEDALRLAGRTGQRAAAVRLYGRLGRLAQQRGDTPAALDALTHAVDLAESLDQPSLLSQALQHLAVAQDAAGDAEAMGNYERALALCRETGDAYGEALMLVNVGARFASSGRRAEAVECLELAVSLTDDLGAVGSRVRSRAEDMLVSARGATPPRPPRAGRDEPAEPQVPAASSEDQVVAPVGDELFAEGSLPHR
ncbi:MAG: tetratricopeptide repeat protein [Chloroflexia bacterium]|nr:tetratricopeptide repeat protein [Chloroflexia bacterium]